MVANKRKTRPSMVAVGQIRGWHTRERHIQLEARVHVVIILSVLATLTNAVAKTMAFPVPEHLPRRPVPVDVSSKILYKIDSATKETLNSALASSWIRELDESILSTKVRLG